MSRWWETPVEPRTLAEKVWDAHVVRSADGEPDLLYIDLHLVHEVTSPQAFDGLRLAGRPVRRPDLTLATEDHNTPTDNLRRPIARSRSRRDPDRDAAPQLRRVRRAAAPARRREPGHRARHRPAARPDPARHDDRLRRLAHRHPRRVRRAGLRHRHQRGRARARHPDAAAGPARRRWRSTSPASCRPGVTAKDLVLALITQVGTGGGVGHVVEYRGPAIEQLSMEGRMTISNMSIEWGAKAGLIAPDETTFAYLKGRAVRAEGRRLGRARVAYWRTPAHRRGRGLRHRGDPRRQRGHARSSPGAPTRARARRWTAWCPTRRSSPTEAERGRRPSGRWSTWTCARHAAARRRRRRGLRRLLHQRPAGGPAGRRRRAARAPGRRRRTDAGGARLGRGARGGRGRRAWTRSSPTPAPSGASPAARCAWA